MQENGHKVMKKNPKSIVTLMVEGKEVETYENFILIGKKCGDERGYRESVNSVTLTREDFNQMLEHARCFITEIRRKEGLEGK